MRRYRPRRRRRRRRRASLYRPLAPGGGVPTSMVVRFTYPFNTFLDASTAPTKYSFRANSCNDPDVTSLGAQPMVWDNLVPLYRQAIVLYSSIHVMASTTSEDSIVGPGTVGVTVASTETEINSGNCLGIVRTRKASMGNPEGGKPFAVIRQNYYASRYWAKRASTNENLTFVPATSGSAVPENQCFFVVWYLPMASSNPSRLNLQGRIVYTVRLFAPQALSTS